MDKTGKNFLDFQLSSYCGYLIGSTAEKDFIIVSRDNGFGSMEDFWDGKEMSGKLISMKRQPAIAVNEEKAESVREILSTAVSGPEKRPRNKRPKVPEKKAGRQNREDGKKNRKTEKS